MRKEEVITLIDSIIPKLYGFAFALVGDELQAEQLIVDAYTVYIMEDVNFLIGEDYIASNKTHRRNYRKYLLREIIGEIYELALKRIPQLASLHSKANRNSDYMEYESFYNLNINKRALLYLKEIAQFSIDEIQEIFAIERFQVLEIFHNSKHEIVKTVELR